MTKTCESKDARNRLSHDEYFSVRMAIMESYSKGQHIPKQLSEITDEFSDQTGLLVSQSSIKSILKDMNISWGRIPEKNLETRVKELEEQMDRLIAKMLKLSEVS